MGFYFSHAQQFSTDEIQYIRDVLKKEKKDLVTQYMALNDAEAQKFWPLYDEFQAKKGDLGKERIQIIKDYADRFNTMTNDQASDIVKRIFKNDKANTALQEKYFKKFAKTVSPLKAAQYLQLEYYFQTLIRSEIQDAIPFIGEIERSKSN
jgi:lysophospholipase L1-like esterase